MHGARLAYKSNIGNVPTSRAQFNLPLQTDPQPSPTCRSKWGDRRCTDKSGINRTRTGLIRATRRRRHLRRLLSVALRSPEPRSVAWGAGSSALAASAPREAPWRSTIEASVAAPRRAFDAIDQVRWWAKAKRSPHSGPRLMVRTPNRSRT